MVTNPCKIAVPRNQRLVSFFSAVTSATSPPMPFSPYSVFSRPRTSSRSRQASYSKTASFTTTCSRNFLSSVMMVGSWIIACRASCSVMRSPLILFSLLLVSRKLHKHQQCSSHNQDQQRWRRARIPAMQWLMLSIAQPGFLQIVGYHLLRQSDTA